jgi:hypothetical protein
MSPSLGFQATGFAAAVWTGEPIWPACRCKISGAGSLIAEALLELDHGTRKIGRLSHRGTRP